MSKRFEEILDICLDRIARGESIEQCLASYPKEAAELEHLLKVALSVTETSSIEPRPAFMNAAKYRLLSALEAKREKRAQHRPLFWGWQRRWATVIAAVLVVFLIGGGTVTASANSLPGDTLYPVKTATEKARVFFTPGDRARAGLHIKFAERRIKEVEALDQVGRPIPPSVLSVMYEETDRAASMLDKEKLREGLVARRMADVLGRNGIRQKELAARLVNMTSNQKRVLIRMINKAPPQEKQKLQRALKRAELAYSRAKALQQISVEPRKGELAPLVPTGTK